MYEVSITYIPFAVSRVLLLLVVGNVKLIFPVSTLRMFPSGYMAFAGITEGQINGDQLC